MALQNKTTQFIEYLISGGVYFWVGYGAFAYFDKILHWSLFYTVIISNLIGWTINYLMLRLWVFRNPSLKNHQTQITGRYIFITLADFLLNYLILRWLKQIGITPYIGQFISAAFFTAWNYFWYRFWVFPEKFPAGHKPKVTIMRLLTHRPHGHTSF